MGQGDTEHGRTAFGPSLRLDIMAKALAGLSARGRLRVELPRFDARLSMGTGRRGVPGLSTAAPAPAPAPAPATADVLSTEAVSVLMPRLRLLVEWRNVDLRCAPRAGRGVAAPCAPSVLGVSTQADISPWPSPTIRANRPAALACAASTPSPASPGSHCCAAGGSAKHASAVMEALWRSGMRAQHASVDASHTNTVPTSSPVKIHVASCRAAVCSLAALGEVPTSGDTTVG